MLNYPEQKDLLKKFSKHSKIAGVIFILLGLAGIIFPGLMSLATAIFFAWLLIFSAFVTGYHTYNINPKDWLGWLKAFIFLITGILIAINPLPGVAALGIIFAIYFLFDSFAGFALAFQIKPQKGWWLPLINGILSLIIAVIFIIGWPFSSLILVGLLVGISLFFDGIVLLSMGSFVDKLNKEK
ncbi:HdeD family acid-resistance protein [Nitrosophilus kaiyonis]|uniref:HdeD family acid-resistance protein n=1 Tax=Nitrosophilus kaiyonis TaxID=2930200 RepID=UPI002491A88A|nr:DUF308 domain-containing protein [Nitrosophilus kaiyonis]